MSPDTSVAAIEREYADFIRSAERLGLAIVRNEPLSRHCTFRIGGPADLFAAAEDIDSLEALANIASENGIPLTILGGGSNVLISDRGIRGLTVANHARQIRIGDPADVRAPKSGQSHDQVIVGELVADSGVALAGLARWAIREGWSGLEWAVSVPGTVGGAVIGNAGAHGVQISDNLAWVLLTAPGAERQLVTAAQLELGYRDSVLKRGLMSGQGTQIVLQAGFAVSSGNSAQMTAVADSYLARRRASQPVEPSAGSVFRNPVDDHAGRLIEAAGLKGHRLGGVQVSPRHANFIINVNEGRAVEVAELMRLIRQRVHDDQGVELVPEILLLGDWVGIE